MPAPLIQNGLPLSPDEAHRFVRHLALPEVGQAGQQRLKAAKVVIIGLGGLGSPAALYLAAAGIGTLGLVDDESVDITNLHRQVLYSTADAGRPKLQCATDKLQAINPELQIIPHPVRLTSANALAILGNYDAVLDASDNFPTRYLVNDACALLRKPDIYGSVDRLQGMATVFAPHLGGPCYRCWYPEPLPPDKVPSGAQAGVLGVVPGVIGTIQATETIKLLIGQGHPLLGRLLRFDALAMSFRQLAIPRDPHCPLCGPQPTITQLTG